MQIWHLVTGWGKFRVERARTGRVQRRELKWPPPLCWLVLVTRHAGGRGSQR